MYVGGRNFILRSPQTPVSTLASPSFKMPSVTHGSVHVCFSRSCKRNLKLYLRSNV